uniref:G-protein coupled receptors family 2 profile 2 domain-containing protein n=1 Tax=Anopheles atroparvus TaxID=41427 RepID=A0AAG5DPS3_ANOAO
MRVNLKRTGLSAPITCPGARHGVAMDRRSAKAVLMVLLIQLVAATSSATSMKPESARSTSLSPMATPPSALSSTKSLTINQCDQQQELVVLKSPNDCFCPPGYASLRDFSPLAGGGGKKVAPLCIGLRSKGPWQDACVSSGTGTDYYDLPPEEMALVRVFLAAHGVSDFWISARRIAPRGALVRRLPGSRWNDPIAQDVKKGPLTVGLPDLLAPMDPGCAAIGGAHFGQLVIRSCSRLLHQLCLYRESALITLYCRQGEYTTRYSSPQQRFCYSVREQTSDTIEQLFGGTSEFEQLMDTTARTRHLRDALLQEFSSANRKHCHGELLLRDSVSQAHRLGKRAQNALSGITNGSATIGCVVLQRAELWRTDEENSSMHLYFDKGQHKLYLTVYGAWRFWREGPKDPGFRCYTNADVKLIRTVKVSHRAKFHPQRQSTHRGDQDEADDVDGNYRDGLGDERTMYELQLVDSGAPVQYWCEAHLLPDLSHLASQPVLAGRRPDGKSFFSATIELLVNHSDVKSLSLASYEQRVEEHIKRHRGRRPELRAVFTALKSCRVKRVDGTRETTDGGGHSVRLILHLVMKRVKSWRSFPIIPELLVNEIGLPENYVQYYKMRWYLHSALVSLVDAQFHLVGVNSTELCLPNSLRVAPGGNIWWTARLGETVTPKNLCLVEDTGLPLTRRCVGDFLYGCAWEPERWTNSGECSHLQHPITRALYEYSTRQMNRSMLSSVFQTVGDVLAMPTSLLPADLFYISKTLENMRQVLVPEKEEEAAQEKEVLEAAPQLGEQYYCNITGIMNRLMYVNRTIVIRSQLALNTTNILLAAFETMINGMALANDSTVLLRGSQFNCDRDMSHAKQPYAGRLALANNDGTVMFRSQRLIVLIVDPTVANISGMALFRKDRQNGDNQTITEHDEEIDDEGDFNDLTIRYLYMNQSQESLLDESDLEIGSFLPESVLENLGPLQEAMTKADEEAEPDEESVPDSTEQPVASMASIPPPSLRIVVMIYYNDRAFRETKNGTIARPNSKIISVTIPGYGSRMPGEIPIYTRQHDPGRASRCGYWSLDSLDDSPGEFGRWSYDECRLVNVSTSGAITICGCFHLTSFSRLTMDTQMVETVGVSKKLIADKSTMALDVITVIGCALSLLGVIGILVTAILFPSWRVKASSKILLQLSCAIAVEMIIIFFEGPDIDKQGISTLDEIECTLLGSVFHYIILVTFMWMLVSAYLQFMRYVKVLGWLRPSHFILKATMCCWGLPALPVVIFLILDHRLYLKQDNVSDICYPHASALYYGLLLPIGAIIFLNFISFVFVLYNIFTIPSNLTKTADHDMTLAQLRLSIFLFFLLGLPWIFGMLTTGSVDKLFAYLFCLTAPLQGFVLFIYFIVMDPIARRLWLRKLQRVPCLARIDKHLDEKETTSPSTSNNTYL